MLKNHDKAESTVETIDADGRWLRVASDSVRLESIDLPDARGSLLVYVPSLRWLYASNAITPLDDNLVLAHARRRGWIVERFGNVRGFVLPARPERGD
jgi:hypothetical protein